MEPSFALINAFNRAANQIHLVSGLASHYCRPLGELLSEVCLGGLKRYVMSTPTALFYQEALSGVGRLSWGAGALLVGSRLWRSRVLFLVTGSRDVTLLMSLAAGMSGSKWVSALGLLLTLPTYLANDSLLFALICLGGLQDVYPGFCSQYVTARTVKIEDQSAHREAFRSVSPRVATVQTDNPHGYSAADRSGADDTITDFIALSGCQTWSLSLSAKDQWRGRAGQKYVYGVRDLVLDTRSDPINSDSIIKMVDVDFYLSEGELGNWLSYGRPIVMYTYRLNAIAGSSRDGDYFPSARDVWTFRTSGGGCYSHSLWDWNTDHFVIWSSEARRMFYVYVETIPLSNGRAIVGLFPAFSFDLTLWLFRDSTYDTTRVLQRLVCHEVSDESGKLYSISFRNGDVNTVNIFDSESAKACTVDEAGFNQALSAIRLSNSFTATTLQKILKTEEPDYHLTRCLKRLSGRPCPLRAAPDSLRRPRLYRYQYSDIHDDTRPTGRVFMDPIIDGAFSPSACKSNDVACIAGRVVAVAPDPRRPTARKYYAYRLEFVQIISQSARGLLVPIDLEEVLARATPKQVAEYLRALQDLRHEDMESFQKTETYPEIKDPRNIINMDKDHVLRWSCFVQVVTQYVKDSECKWYAFGLNPKEVGDTIHRFVAFSSFEILETDFSRFDGTICQFLRELELLLFLSLFHPRYRHAISKLWAKTLNQVGRTRHGVSFFLASQRRSGSGETSLGNTLINAFIGYCCNRELGMGSREAYASLGVYGGDDGVSSLPPGIMEKVCADLQLVVKPKYIHHGDPVSFLGRIWPEPAAHPGSFIDPMRVLTKIHYVSNADPGIPPEIHAWRKGVSLYATESCTPVLGVLGKALMRIAGPGSHSLVFESRPHKAFINELVGKPLTTDAILTRFQSDPVFTPIRQTMHNYRIFARCIQDATGLELAQLSAWFDQLTDWACEPDLHPPFLFRMEINSPKSTVDIDGLQVGPTLGPAPSIPTKQDLICPLWATRNCPPGCTGKHPANVCRDHLRGVCQRGTRCKFQH